MAGTFRIDKTAALKYYKEAYRTKVIALLIVYFF